MMKVKICGITDLETALTAVENGADALGFVFAKSRRKIEPQHAKKIIQQLPSGILMVGVFVNELASTIEKIVIETGINMVQLHGDEAPCQCKGFSVPVIKAFSITSKEVLEQIHAYPCEFILLDSPKGKYYGGNGVKFDWKPLIDFAPKDKKVILAGGLNVDNVAEAISFANPFMVDVSSGVETAGKKDLQKMKTFLRKAKSVKEKLLNE